MVKINTLVFPIDRKKLFKSHAKENKSIKIANGPSDEERLIGGFVGIKICIISDESTK